MIIDKVFIKKFRGFEEVQFQLGKQLTVIAGQNGTQKTTLLGMLSQPFSITDKSSPLYGEKPLCGGSFKSAFAEKFKLSEAFDKPKNHEWTLRLCDDTEDDFTLESMQRDSSSNSIRFWKKGVRTKGSGYIQIPVIYLSLSRLFPIGEDNTLDSSNDVILTKSEFEFYEEWHNKILIIPDVSMENADYLASKQKNTLGANTEYYDWRMNSAGQDNIGKIILAILSFKRLKEKHDGNYHGGILAIDEADVTFYPASQLKLVDALRKFASKYDIQIVFTTHSLSMLERSCEMQHGNNGKNNVKVIYLERRDRKIRVIEDLTFEIIQHKLNVSLGVVERATKIPVFTEDKEAQAFLKAVLKRKGSQFLKYLDCELGCNNLIDLSRKKIPGFRFPDSIIVLDGDVKENSTAMREVNKSRNILILPGNNSPEKLIAKFLFDLSDESQVWGKIHQGYTKQVCFRDYTYSEIQSDREKAKRWFKSQRPYWGSNCVKVINPWVDQEKKCVDEFVESCGVMVNKFFNVL
jgi:predicted ATPase